MSDAAGKPNETSAGSTGAEAVEAGLPAALALPQTLIGRADLSRLIRELEALDNELEAQKVRSHGTAAAELGETSAAAGEAVEHGSSAADLPGMGRTLTDLVQLNKLDLAKPSVRDDVKKRLSAMKDTAPSMHVTFAADPEPEFLRQLVGWIRQEISPAALVDVGLQPALIGGVYLRTPNHVHDFSLRTLLAGKRELLVHELEALGGQ